jgi:hypothetical protein
VDIREGAKLVALASLLVSAALVLEEELVAL